MVEIADSTVTFDLTVKSRLYARAGIVEYWVVIVPRKQLIVHREPKAGTYIDVVTYEASATVASLAAPGALFCLDLLTH